jgi:hypothetical protein
MQVAHLGAKPFLRDAKFWKPYARNVIIHHMVRQDGYTVDISPPNIKPKQEQDQSSKKDTKKNKHELTKRQAHLAHKYEILASTS